MLRIILGKQTLLRAVGETALLLACAWPAIARAQPASPVLPSGAAYQPPPGMSSSSPGRTSVEEAGDHEPARGGAFALPSNEPLRPAGANAEAPLVPPTYPHYPPYSPSPTYPAGHSMQSVLVPSAATQSRMIHLAEMQEELPPPGLQPIPLPPVEEELPLILEDDCGCSTCLPGQFRSCPPCLAHTRLGRFFWTLHRDVCCPDPCYDPHWWALADAAFFTGAARPVSQQRFRWDAGYDMIFPDRAEYFWARSGGGGKGPAVIQPGLRYHDLSMYTEIAAGKFGMFTEVPYRSVYPEIGGHNAGFGDMSVGTKSMLHDSELLQVTFQMTTYIPLGMPNRGLGTGHVSLEPSLIMGLNLSPYSYLQAQVAEWIPIAGDQHYAGALLRFNSSYNVSLLGSPEAAHLIGTLELNGWGFQDGAYSSPTLGQFQPANDYIYVSAGPGLRLVICDTIDFGAGSAFALTSDHFAEQLLRTELRMRF